MYRPVILLFALSTLIGTSAPAQPPAIAAVPDEVDLDPLAVVERHGQPDLAVGNLLVYRRSFAELPVDVTFFVSAGLVREMSFAFSDDELGPERLRSDADRVLKRLRMLHGAPSGSVRLAGEYKSHVWRDARGEMLHIVVYTPGREEHTLRVVRRASPLPPEHDRGSGNREPREASQ